MITLEIQEKSFVICIMTTHGELWRPTGGNVLRIWILLRVEKIKNLSFLLY